MAAIAPAALAAFATLAAQAPAAAQGAEPPARTATITRTTHGIPHIRAADPETLAYAFAYAHAQDNVCQTADQLVTVRGERGRFFGATVPALLGRRMLPNGQIDAFIAAHMDDAALARAWAGASAEAQAGARGAVAGYNRYLSDHAGRLPAACNGQPWVQPMTLAELYRQAELSAVQAGVAALADAVLAARPPEAPSVAGTAVEAPVFAMAAYGTATDPAAAVAQSRSGFAPLDADRAREALREIGLVDSPLGSNAWAFGRATTADRGGLLLANPHFPWAGFNRFWQVHLTLQGAAGQPPLDVMGVALGNFPFVSIGFNRDVAWSHTVSTGRRFTLHELKLVPGQPTHYLLDGEIQAMVPRTVRTTVAAPDGTLQTREHTVWHTVWGPVLEIARAGLHWSAHTAYAVQDANSGNVRTPDTSLALGRARSVHEARAALANLGLPWVNTIAADRHGEVLYADLSVVPDVDEAQLQRCRPGFRAAALRAAAGLIVLDGSRRECGWRQDSASPAPGRIPPARLPAAVREDWVQNSNDSFHFTHPQQRWPEISPLVGEPRLSRQRTRAGLTEIPELLARGPVTAEGVQAQLYDNRNFTSGTVLPDLLAACAAQPPASPSTTEARDGCAALQGWDRKNQLGSRGAHLFREFWRRARGIAGVHRVPLDPAQPVATPAGLKMADAGVAARVWGALTEAVTAVRAAGFALDAPLGTVQRPLITDEPIGLHGGEEMEGVLNNLGNQFVPGIRRDGLRIDYGASIVMTVRFDARGPLAQGLLSYGQSTDPASPHANDQLRRFSRGEWPALPFHAEDIAKARIGEVLTLVRP